MHSNIETTNADGPLHGADQRLVYLSIVFAKELGSISLGMVIAFKRGLSSMRGILVEQSLVCIDHLLNVTLERDAQLTAAISTEGHTKVVRDLTSTLQFEFVLVGKCLDDGLLN
jgi:hypothetical protein